MSISKKLPVIASAMLMMNLPSMAVNHREPLSHRRGVSLASAQTTSSRQPIWSQTVNVPYRSWIPMERPRAVLLAVHGLGFSSKSFTEFGRRMAARGFAVYALDVRGFGEWLKRRSGDQVDFEACLTDVESGLRTLRKSYPRTPIFLVGESMGGAIALRATSRYPELVNGLVSSVPSSDRYAKMSSEMIVGARYLEDKDKEISIAPEVMNRATANPKLRAKWAAEPTNRVKMTPRELRQFDQFMKGNDDAAALVATTPVLMLAGFKDKLVRPEGTIVLFNNLSTPDKLLMIVGDGEHLLLEENQLTDELAQLITDWINSEARPGRTGINAHP